MKDIVNEKERYFENGLDIGSTTIKCVELGKTMKSYINPMNGITPRSRKKIWEILQYVRDNVVKEKTAQLAISGSAGMGVAETAARPLCRRYSPPGWRRTGFCPAAT